MSEKLEIISQQAAHLKKLQADPNATPEALMYGAWGVVDDVVWDTPLPQRTALLPQARAAVQRTVEMTRDQVSNDHLNGRVLIACWGIVTSMSKG